MDETIQLRLLYGEFEWYVEQWAYLVVFFVDGMGLVRE